MTYADYETWLWKEWKKVRYSPCDLLFQIRLSVATTFLHGKSETESRYQPQDWWPPSLGHLRASA